MPGVFYSTPPPLLPSSPPPFRPPNTPSRKSPFDTTAIYSKCSKARHSSQTVKKVNYVYQKGIVLELAQVMEALANLQGQMEGGDHTTNHPTRPGCVRWATQKTSSRSCEQWDPSMKNTEYSSSWQLVDKASRQASSQAQKLAWGKVGNKTKRRDGP